MVAALELMDLDPLVQLRQLGAFVLVGAALGLWYDFLRPLRRGAVMTATSDLLFGLSALAVLFGAGQMAAERALYLYMAGGCVLGFFLWRALMSAPMRQLGHGLKAKMAQSPVLAWVKKSEEAVKKSAVSLFSSAVKWVTIVLEQRRQTRRARGRRHTAYETAQGKLADDARHRGAACLRRSAPVADARKTGRGRADKNRA